jgi:hypothetical protein
LTCAVCMPSKGGMLHLLHNRIHLKVRDHQVLACRVCKPRSL